MDLLLAYYGDDFTGSTDVLEALSRGGIETVLFVEPPTAAQLARYPQVRAVGVAGTGRTMSPAGMDAVLPSVFAALKQLEPKFVHYKVCSTFDSSPQIGSIGRAIDIGCQVFQNQFVPLVVGAPVLQRFCVFGNLFARSGLDSPAYRLDRHPTMRQHPTTPMTESDLCVHLAEQTERPIGLVDVLALDAGYEAAARKLAHLTEQSGSITLFDTLTTAHLTIVGRLMAEAQYREKKPLFVAGSSGVEYALTQRWKAKARTEEDTPVTPVDRTLVVSGSCSPVTERQIAWAVKNGFAEFAAGTAGSEVAAALDAGRSAIVHSLRAAVHDPRQVGAILGRTLNDVMRKCRLQRVAVVGGDTAGQVARELRIETLEYIGPLEPGAPLCRARSSDPVIDGLEITFKGGQVGHDDFFATLLRGRRAE